MQVPHPESSNWPEPGAGPVTITVTRVARPGKEAEFEEWLGGVCTAASKFEGHRGFTVLRPPNAARREYILIFRFDSMQNLQRWNHSPVRNDWIERARPLTVGEPRVELTTGLEHWFTLPASATLMPPRYKMALLTWMAIFPLILGFSTLVLPYLAGLPWPVPTALTSAMLVLLMTYVVMPRVTRLFMPWLTRARS
jgi:antibiotic biosynthesis monooxygenase (ABM) superfamily enzyme